jgi:hypothetical protein
VDRESMAIAIRNRYGQYLKDNNRGGLGTPWQNLSMQRREKWLQMADAAILEAHASE